MASRVPRNDTSPSSLRRSREVPLKTAKTLTGSGDSLVQSHIDEMLHVMDTVPQLQKRFTIDNETLERVRKNASGTNASATPKRPRSDSADISQTESAKRIRSSLRSSSKSHAPPNQPDFSEEITPIKQEAEKPKPSVPQSKAKAEIAPVKQEAEKPKLPVPQSKAKAAAPSEPEKDDVNALLTYARDLKHRGEAERKPSHDLVKKDPSAVSAQYDRFVESYLRASLAYLRCCALYEIKRLVDQARDVYDSTAKLAIYAAAGITEESPMYRRALASLCLKAASVAYARRYQMDRKKCTAVNAQLEETIRSKATDITAALDLVKKLRVLSDECDSDARASQQRWAESVKVAPDGLNDFEIEIPLNPEAVAFADFAKAEQQRARYLGETD